MIKINLTAFVILLVLYAHLMLAQNLAPNPSFEEYNKCPENYTSPYRKLIIPKWYAYGATSPDYFNVCSEGGAGVPNNFAGISEARSGNAYIGLITWELTHVSMEAEIREYIQTELKDTLLSGEKYYFEFYYKLASNSNYASNKIGLHLSKQEFDLTTGMQPTVEVVKESPVSETTGIWEKANGIILANGGESYLTIGNFSDNRNTVASYIKKKDASVVRGKRRSYFYIDDVLLRKVNEEDSSLVTNDIEDGRITILTDLNFLDSLYNYKNITFEVDDDKLSAAYYQQLTKLSKLLTSSSLKVKLVGHADDSGSIGYNRRLSIKRAESVGRYLASKGVDMEKVLVEGRGEVFPLTSVEESDKAKDRRVEIKIIRDN